MEIVGIFFSWNTNSMPRKEFIIQKNETARHIQREQALHICCTVLNYLISTVIFLSVIFAAAFATVRSA